MKFSKYSGAGNTFLITQEKDPLSSQEISYLCDFHQVDGFIRLIDFTMSYYNADGGEASMCGNGLRCAIKYLWEKGIRKDLYEIRTRAGIQKGKIVGEEVLCYLQPPTLYRWDQELRVDNEPLRFHFINTSVPHALFFMEPPDVALLGRKIRRHPYFAPEGTNVNFITYIDRHRIRLRTYERGVERETLACGTGSIASALAAHKEYGACSPIQVEVRSGECLTVSFQAEQGSFKELSLQGSSLKMDL